MGSTWAGWRERRGDKGADERQLFDVPVMRRAVGVLQGRRGPRTRRCRGDASYAWGRKALRFVRYAECGCVMNWTRIRRNTGGRVVLNARNVEPYTLRAVRIGRRDGASSWRCLADAE